MGGAFWKHLSGFRPESLKRINGYSREEFVRDLLAGMTVGVVALPLGIAFAIASGVSPERGLFTGIVAGFLISLLGGSRFQIGGPTGAFVAIVAGIVARHGYDGLVVVTLMAGVFLMAMGFLRMGRLLQYIPYPVTTGFTAGIAVYIFSTQFREILGIAEAPTSPSFYGKLSFCLDHLSGITPAAIGVTLFTIVVMIAVRRFVPRIPSHFAGVVAATLAVQVAGLEVATIGSRFGSIPATLPSLSFPDHFWAMVPTLIPDAIAVALLGGIESLLSAVVADGMTGERHAPSTELVAQGIANIASALFGGIPATGAIARTATNIRAGAASPVSGMIHAATLMGCMLFLAPFAVRIPMASLAGVLTMVAWDMSELPKFVRLMKAPSEDVLVLLASFLLTVFVDLTVAVEVGVVMAAFLFMRRMVRLADFQLRSPYPDPDEQADTAHWVRGVEIYEIEGPFFFGVANRFLDVLGVMHRAPEVVILRLRHIKTIDATAAHALEMAIDRVQKRKIRILLSGVNPRVREILDRLGIADRIGPGEIFSAFPDALKAAQAHHAQLMPSRPRKLRQGRMETA